MTSLNAPDSHNVKDTVSSEMIACHSVIRQASVAYFTSLWIEFPAIIYVRQGTKHIEHNEQHIEVEAEQAITFSPHQTVNVKNVPGTEQDYIADVFIFNNRLIQDLYRQSDVNNTAAEPFSRIHVNPEMKKVLLSAKESLQSAALPNSIVEHRGKEILLWLIESSVFFHIPNKETLYDKVRKLILTDLSHNWKAPEVADHLAMSESSLRRRLSDTDHSFIDILTDARLTRALELLQTTDMPVTTIALEVGYSSPSSFTERFKSRMNISPTAIRKKQF